MMVQPSNLTSHTHEQICYVAEGRINFFLDGEPTTLEQGDMFTVPANVPHNVQLLTEHVRGGIHLILFVKTFYNY